MPYTSVMPPESHEIARNEAQLVRSSSTLQYVSTCIPSQADCAHIMCPCRTLVWPGAALLPWGSPGGEQCDGKNCFRAQWMFATMHA